VGSVTGVYARLDSEVADIEDINCKVIHSLCKIDGRDSLNVSL